MCSQAWLTYSYSNFRAVQQTCQRPVATAATCCPQVGFVNGQLATSLLHHSTKLLCLSCCHRFLLLGLGNWLGVMRVRNVLFTALMLPESEGSYAARCYSNMLLHSQRELKCTPLKDVWVHAGAPRCPASAVWRVAGQPQRDEEAHDWAAFLAAHHSQRAP